MAAPILNPDSLKNVGQAIIALADSAKENPYVLPHEAAVAALQPAVNQANAALQAPLDLINRTLDSINTKLDTIDTRLEALQTSVGEVQTSLGTFGTDFRNQAIAAGNRASHTLTPLLNRSTGLPISSPPFPTSAIAARDDLIPTQVTEIANQLDLEFPAGSTDPQKLFTLLNYIGARYN